MQSHIHQTEDHGTETLTDQEAAEVVKLWAEKQNSGFPGPGHTSVRDVAEGLDIPPEVARALLDEVRGRKEVFRELPVNFATSPPASVYTSLTAGALGLGVLGVLMQTTPLSVFAAIILIATLLAARRWGLAALTLIAAMILLLGIVRTEMRSSAPAYVTIPESAVPGPPPPPELPIPPPSPAPR